MHKWKRYLCISYSYENPLIPFRKKEIKQIMTKDTINFASISPSTDLFPVESFKSIVNEILEGIRAMLLAIKKVKDMKSCRSLLRIALNHMVFYYRR